MFCRSSLINSSALHHSSSDWFLSFPPLFSHRRSFIFPFQFSLNAFDSLIPPNYPRRSPFSPVTHTHTHTHTRLQKGKKNNPLLNLSFATCCVCLASANQHIQNWLVLFTQQLLLGRAKWAAQRAFLFFFLLPSPPSLDWWSNYTETGRAAILGVRVPRLTASGMNITERCTFIVFMVEKGKPVWVHLHF